MTKECFIECLQQNLMFPVIDFRNGRYQGQTKDQLPHGLGCFVDRNFMFCVGEWIAGELNGLAIIIFPSGRIFCGRINYRKMDGLCSFELAEDHVQLIVYTTAKRNQRQMEKIAGLLPLMKIILEIDNTNPQNATVLREFEYSQRNEEENFSTVSKIVNLDRNGAKVLYSCRSFLQYFQDHFFRPYPNVFQYLISDNKGRKQHFIGLKGEGLGVRIQPNEQVTLNMKKTGRVYFIRGMGYFTRENQLKDLGIKMKDNSMKGVIYEQGVFALPKTVISYENGKRPVNCSINFHNYMKRSLFYRDKILNTEYLQNIQSYVYGFNENLRKIETQRVAQQTIERPNREQKNLTQIQQRRKEKSQYFQPTFKAKQTIIEPQRQNPYHPMGNRVTNPEYNLNIAKDEIYRSANKKRHVPDYTFEEYKKSEYVDPNYKKVDRDYSFVPNRQVERQRVYDFETTPRQMKPYKRDQRIENNFGDEQQPFVSRRRQRLQTSPYQRNPYPEDVAFSNYPNSLYPQRNRSPNRQFKHLYDSPSSWRDEEYNSSRYSPMKQLRY